MHTIRADYGGVLQLINAFRFRGHQHASLDPLGLWKQNGREALREVVRAKPDVVLLDVSMPELDGIAAAREITRAAPEVGILMLTMHEDDDTVREAMRLLASLGASAPSELSPAMRRRNLSQGESASYAELYDWLEPGELLADQPESWKQAWEAADPNRFGPVRRTPARAA